MHRNAWGSHLWVLSGAYFLVWFLLNLQAQIKENIKAPRHWPLWGDPPVANGFLSQRASSAENFQFDDVIMPLYCNLWKAKTITTTKVVEICESDLWNNDEEIINWNPMCVVISIVIPPSPKLGGYSGFILSVCLSVRLSVCLSVNLSCPPCIYSSRCILSIFGTNDQ